MSAILIFLIGIVATPFAIYHGNAEALNVALLCVPLSILDLIHFNLVLSRQQRAYNQGA